jgi:L-lysine 6-transaminase
MNPTMRHELDAQDVRKFLSGHMLVDGLDFVLDLEKSQGSRLRDAASGKTYTDLFGFFGSAALGMNHPRMHRPEVEADLLAAARSKPSNADFVTLAMGGFVERMSRTVMSEELPYLFFIEGGALAVENALKTAFDWKTRLNADRGIAAAGHRIVHLREAFHGRSGYTMSLTNTDPLKVHSYPKFDWPRVVNPKILWPLEGENLAAVEAAERLSLRQMEEAFERYPNEIAAIILEPIQGEGGDSHFRTEYFRELRRLADEQDALLIFDEVQCGWGTTGKWWAWQHHGVAPDVICFGKKAQTCGILASRRLDEVENHVFALSSRINSTWGGNLVDMVRSAHQLDVIVEERLLENVSRVGEHAKARVRQMQARHPELVSQVRGLGGMIAFDLPTAEQRNKLRKEAFRQQVLVLACGQRSIRFRPALTITVEEMDEGLARLEKALEAV